MGKQSALLVDKPVAKGVSNGREVYGSGSIAFCEPEVMDNQPVLAGRFSEGRCLVGSLFVW